MRYRNEEMMSRVDDINKLLEGEDFRVEARVLWKNNLEVVGWTLRNPAVNTGATVYYDSIAEFWDSDEEIVEFLKNVYANNKLDLDVSKCSSKEYILANVRAKLVSSDNLEAVVKNQLVHRDFLDMLVLYFVQIDELTDTNGSATFTVNEYMISNAGISEEELYMNALTNIEAEYEIKSMASIIAEMMGVEEDEMPGVDDGIKMVVGTNKQRLYGASVMLSNKVIEELAKQFNGEFAILPSSVHEFIAVPTQGSSDDYRKMVTEVNDSEVDAIDRLTYNVYRYKDGLISIY